MSWYDERLKYEARKLVRLQEEYDVIYHGGIPKGYRYDEFRQEGIDESKKISLLEMVQAQQRNCVEALTNRLLATTAWDLTKGTELLSLSRCHSTEELEEYPDGDAYDLPEDLRADIVRAITNPDDGSSKLAYEVQIRLERDETCRVEGCCQFTNCRCDYCAMYQGRYGDDEAAQEGSR